MCLFMKNTFADISSILDVHKNNNGVTHQSYTVIVLMCCRYFAMMYKTDSL